MLRVTQIRTSRTRTSAILRATIRCSGSRLDGVDLWFGYPPKYYEHLSLSADPWIAGLVTIAMRLRRTLRVDAPASPRLLEGAQRFMDIMRLWRPECDRVPIETDGVTSSLVPGRSSPGPLEGRGTSPRRGLDPEGRCAAGRRVGEPRNMHHDGCVGAFFTAGVDSFYSLLKNHRLCRNDDRISHVLFVHGFDVRLSDRSLYALCRSEIIQAARRLDTIPILCATNIKEQTCDKGLDVWDMCHGQMLIAVALAIGSMWRQVLVGASHCYAELPRYGSHPLTDPLWSTDTLRIVHDGAEATRVEKIAGEIAASDVAMQYLRVCWQNTGGRYNCCECEKCLRTMVALDILGILDKCRSFDRPLRYAEVARMKFPSLPARMLMVQNYEAALARGANLALIRAMRQALYPSLTHRMCQSLHDYGKRVARRVDRTLLGGRVRSWHHRAKPQRFGEPALAGACLAAGNSLVSLPPVGLGPSGPAVMVGAGGIHTACHVKEERR